MPVDVNHWVRIFWILPAAVNAATASAPKMLMAACMIIVPEAVIANWSAIGRPTRIWWDVASRSRRHMPFSGWRMAIFFLMYTIQRTAEIPWERSVAKAAPATPMWNTMMNTRSRTTFRQAEKTRKNSGILLSPTARIMDENRL